ncbi:MAG: tetratricopeptide repeat protein [Cyclobacteriaceae bacterium]|nr:tetratricopeptide repeat protein [Cyclobacteriaceae bacterium]
MDNERIKMLLAGVKEEPNDPFYPYGLALEYIVLDPQKAVELLESLLQTHPDYLPTYYTAAKLFSISNSERAIAILEAGFELAKAQQNAKAQREIQSALDELMF